MARRGGAPECTRCGSKPHSPMRPLHDGARGFASPKYLFVVAFQPGRSHVGILRRSLVLAFLLLVYSTDSLALPSLAVPLFTPPSRRGGASQDLRRIRKSLPLSSSLSSPLDRASSLLVSPSLRPSASPSFRPVSFPSLVRAFPSIQRRPPGVSNKAQHGKKGGPWLQNPCLKNFCCPIPILSSSLSPRSSVPPTSALALLVRLIPCRLPAFFPSPSSSTFLGRTWRDVSSSDALSKWPPQGLFASDSSTQSSVPRLVAPVFLCRPKLCTRLCMRPTPRNAPPWGKTSLPQSPFGPCLVDGSGTRHRTATAETSAGPARRRTCRHLGGEGTEGEIKRGSSTRQQRSDLTSTFVALSDNICALGKLEDHAPKKSKWGGLGFLVIPTCCYLTIPPSLVLLLLQAGSSPLPGEGRRILQSFSRCPAFAPVAQRVCQIETRMTRALSGCSSTSGRKREAGCLDGSL